MRRRERRNDVQVKGGGKMGHKRKRFSLSLSALTVICVTVASLAAVSSCIAIFASVYSRSLMRDAKVNSDQTVQQTAIAVNNNLEAMKNKLTAVRNILYESKDPDDFRSKTDALTKIQNDIFAVMVYDSEGNILSCTGSGNTLKKEIYKDLSFDKALFEGAADFALSEPHVQTLFDGVYPWVVTLALRTDRQVFGNGAYVAIDFSFSEIAKYIDKVGVGRHGYCYITDAEGNIIYHPQQQLIFSHLKSEDAGIVSSLSDGVHEDENVIYTLSTTYDRSWRIVGVSYTDELVTERRSQILMSIAVSLLCCAAVSVAVLAVYAIIVNAPVRSLIKAMKAFENAADSFSYSSGNKAVTELQVLSDSFEHMSNRIKQLMERVRTEETELRKTELKALQAQINPHFLYNTLDSIQWMCEQGKNEDAMKMVSALAKLFRISISRGHELIPIKDELQHAKNYLVIQSYRYRNQFSYSFDIETRLEHYLCNKITVQPLIENAIYHGIDRMVDEGEIKISVKEAPDNKDDILITVEDNGVGMTEEQCRKILRKERSDSSGIGVKNVNDRLKIYFGEKYGLTIKSELDVGTIVTVRIPKIEAEAENEN